MINVTAGKVYTSGLEASLVGLDHKNYPVWICGLKFLVQDNSRTVHQGIKEANWARSVVGLLQRISSAATFLAAEL